MPHFRNMLFIVVLLGLFTAWPSLADDKKPAPIPNKPDVALAPEMSLRRAAEFLDATSRSWTETKKCGSCHTNYPYLMARPSLHEPEAPAMKEMRAFFEDRAANWDTRKPRWDTEVVATAAVLAFHDARTTGKLHSVSKSALDRMWSLQRPDGSWNWLKCNWPPAESDDYYGVVFAALGVGMAPDGYAKSAQAHVGMEKIRTYLGKNSPPSLHHQTMLLWAATALPELMPDPVRQATIKDLLDRQRPDGGWSLPALGNWKRHSGEANDPAATSDGYGTGLVVYVLRQAGLEKDHAAVQKGIGWLKANQRQSGRWFTRSLSNDKYHYITHAGTAYAVMALAACEEKPVGTR